MQFSIVRAFARQCAAPLLAALSVAFAGAAAAQTPAPAPAAAPAVLQVAPPVIAARSFVLLDIQSGQVLTASNPDQPVEPASLTKIMTAYVVFKALAERRITLDQKVNLSMSAWEKSGKGRNEQSNMWIDLKVPVTIEEMLHGMIIVSANDASYMLAEVVGGSEAGFADLMNKEAARLGLKGTRFTNAAGITEPGHITTAADMARLAQALIRDFPEQYAKYYSQRSYSYNKITQENRNRLLWLDPTVDGMKTGYTAAAGYCLVSSARRPGAHGSTRRLISVVMGTASMDARAQESVKLLNWGFQNFENVRVAQANTPLVTPEIWKGKAATVKLGFTQDAWISVPRGMGDKLKSEVTRPQPLVAPVQAGQTIGSLRVSADGRIVAEKPVQVLETVEQAGLIGRAWDSVRLMFK